MARDPFLTRKAYPGRPVRHLLPQKGRDEALVTIYVVDVHRREHEIIASVGGSVMEAARAHNVAGIDGACGGACLCATCHVTVAHSFWDQLSEIGDQEAALLESLPVRRKTSRLSCQISLYERLNGLKVSAVKR